MKSFFDTHSNTISRVFSFIALILILVNVPIRAISATKEFMQVAIILTLLMETLFLSRTVNVLKDKIENNG